MRSAKLRRILSLALATVFCLGASLLPHNEETVSAKASSYNEPTVRVGLYVNASKLDTRMFSSANTSDDGFDIGYSSGSFNKLFTISNSGIILLPQVNASYNAGSCTKGDGNIGSYSAVYSAHTDYSAAANEAKRIGGFVAVVNGGYEVRGNASSSEAAAKTASGGRTVKAPVSGGLTVLDANGKILFTFEDSNRKLAIRSANGGTVSFPTEHRTGKTNNYSYLGYFEYSVDGGQLRMINCVGLEDYTKCVMSNEIGTNVSVETRKAFSVLARTVPFGRKHGTDSYDVCNNSACCQVYRGTFRMSEENNSIVDSTRGLICTYNGTPIRVLYHNSNGGASCSSVAAWGGSEIPYLTTVFIEESGETDVWTLEYTKEEFYYYITSRSSFSSLEDEDLTMKILETDPYGSDYITVLSVSDGSGNTVQVENAESVRTACGFDSANFKLEYSTSAQILTSDGTVETAEVKGVLTAEGYEEFEGFDKSYTILGGAEIEAEKVIINGEGAGHGVGFSAIGSEQLAKDGYSYKYILEFFFNGTKLQYPN